MVYRMIRPKRFHCKTCGRQYCSLRCAWKHNDRSHGGHRVFEDTTVAWLWVGSPMGWVSSDE